MQSKVSELKTAACALFGLAEKDVELLDFFNSGIHCTLEDKLGQSLHEAHINEGQDILLGEQVDRQPNPATPAEYRPSSLFAFLHFINLENNEGSSDKVAARHAGYTLVCQRVPGCLTHGIGLS